MAYHLLYSFLFSSTFSIHSFSIFAQIKRQISKSSDKEEEATMREESANSRQCLHFLHGPSGGHNNNKLPNWYSIHSKVQTSGGPKLDNDFFAVNFRAKKCSFASASVLRYCLTFCFFFFGLLQIWIFRTLRVPRPNHMPTTPPSLCHCHLVWFCPV